MSEKKQKNERLFAHRVFEVGERKPNYYDIRSAEVEQQKFDIVENTRSLINQLSGALQQEQDDLTEYVYSNNQEHANYVFYRLAQQGMLRQVDLSCVRIGKLYLSDLDLSGLDFSNAHFEMCFFNKCDFSNAKFIGANLDTCIFEECQYENVDFTGSSVQRVWFGNLTSKQTIAANAQFNGAIFRQADLRWSVIIHDFANVDAREANMQHTWFQADLRNTNMTNARLLNAIFWLCTVSDTLILPDGNPQRLPDNLVVRYTDSSDPDYWEPEQMEDA